VAVHFSRLEDLTGEGAVIDRATYLALGIKARVEIPLMIGDAVVGTLALSTLGAERTWRDELVQRLRLFGEMFANNLSRKRSELEAQGLRNDLAHAGRVATVGELTASLAHELNQPLTAILSKRRRASVSLTAFPWTSSRWARSSRTSWRTTSGPVRSFAAFASSSRRALLT
jgi:signal transduction histidine kinase